ncbi:MAG: shikimate dehydrogenase [Alphaproteobacteria bacterium]|nr:shikimate dehydrogenase [Alphaproteobacteria bacterium]
MSLSGATRLYAVLGSPVRHSLSPRLHNAAFAAHGIDAVYLALEVSPDRAARVPDALRTLGLAGANLTVPLKERVVAGLDEVVGVARVLGAVNTVVAHEGRLVGHNTDAAGFVAGVRQRREVTGCRAVVLGAGGAGLACGAGLAEAGAAEVVFLNRTLARAEAAATRCRAAWPATAFAAGALDDFADVVTRADLVVQATSGGAADAVAALPVDHVRAGALWVDLGYWAPAPLHADVLSARGVDVQDGKPMLVHQAALAFRHFTGISPDPAMLSRTIG